MNFIVPAHLHGLNNGFVVSFSSERQILHTGVPELDPNEGYRIINGVPFSSSFNCLGMMTILGVSG